jgi:murein L,D-transpeptidase YcbB/YkuD
MSPFEARFRVSRRPGLILALVAIAVLSIAAAWRPVPVAVALREEVARLSERDRYISEIYQARDFKPLWSRDGRPDVRAATLLIGWLSRADDDGLSAERYPVRELRDALNRATSGRPRDLARLDVLSSRAMAEYESELHSPGPATSAVIIDPALAPPSPASALRAASEAPLLVRHLEDARRMHPIYDALRAEYTRARSGAQSMETQAYRRRLLANMDRARMLPGVSKARYVLVDAAVARLWMYENGRPVDSMEVVVGKTSQPTPILAGLIRYAAVDPYWNIPPDLARDQLAPKVLQQGPGVLEKERLEVLADWSPSAAPLSAEAVDWTAVAAGEVDIRVRQKPGPGNMMGRVKFMFPNRLGVYLHDTSDHGVFARRQRRLSAGCVRVEDAARLSRWLGAVLPPARSPTERRVDLPTPTPVYITYFTIGVRPNGVERRADPYGRDDPWVAAKGLRVAGQDYRSRRRALNRRVRRA